MLCARTRFTDSPRRPVGLGCRFPQVVMLASFAAIVGIAGYVPAADPAPAGPKAAPPTSKEESRGQPVEMEKKDQIERLAKEIHQKRLDYLAEQRAYRKEIIEQCGVSPENVLPLLLALEKDWLGLKTEAMVKERREKVIEAMLAKAAGETEKPTKSDAVLQHLEKIIAVRKAALNRAQSVRKTNAIPESEVQQAEADLAEAEIRAELRKEELGKSQANAEAGRLAQQARELRIEVTMDVMRNGVLELKLGELRRARDMLDEYNRITEVELPALNRQLQELQIRLMQGQIDAP
jgi:hypothetical protein